MLEIIDSIGGDVKDQLVFINTLKHYNEQKHKTVVPLVVDIGKLHLIFLCRSMATSYQFHLFSNSGR
jgi:ATP-dependent protease ClpP protease subunit